MLLFRALRNKKHHYNELSAEVKSVYGRMPDEFTAYWTDRFPGLLVHVWHAMHCIKNEDHFKKYFDRNYDFISVRQCNNDFFSISIILSLIFTYCIC